MGGHRSEEPGRTWLLRFQDWILDIAEHITDVLQSETGKTRADASIEPPACADLLNYWAGNAERFLADTRQAARPHLPRRKSSPRCIGPIRWSA